MLTRSHSGSNDLHKFKISAITLSKCEKYVWSLLATEFQVLLILLWFVVYIHNVKEVKFQLEI